MPKCLTPFCFMYLNASTSCSRVMPLPFGLLRGIHDGVVQTKSPPGLKRRDMVSLPVAYYLVVEIEVGNIIDVDDGIQSRTRAAVPLPGDVGENMMSCSFTPQTSLSCSSGAGAVTAETPSCRIWMRRGFGVALTAEVFPCSRIPRKCFLYLAGVLTDRLLIVNVERSRMGFGDLLHLLERQKGFLFHWCVRLFRFTGVFSQLFLPRNSLKSTAHIVFHALGLDFIDINDTAVLDDDHHALAQHCRCIGTVEIHHFAVCFNDYGIAFKAILQFRSALSQRSPPRLIDSGRYPLGIPFYLHYLLLKFCGLLCAVMVGIRLIGHCLGRCQCQRADNNDGKQTEHKAGTISYRSEMPPDSCAHTRSTHAADDNAGIRALLVRASPEQRTQNQRTEGRAKTAHA